MEKKGPCSQSYGFSSSRVWFWKLDYKKSECRRIDTFELWCWRRLLRVPWTASRLNQPLLKEINPEHSLEGLMLKLQYFGHLMWRADSSGKDPAAGKDWGQKKKGMTEDKMIGWHHWLNGHEFEQFPGIGDGQGSLACCSPWGRKELDTTEWLNWTVNLNGLEFLRNFWKKISILYMVRKFCCLNTQLGIQNREVTYGVRMHKTETFSRYIEISLFLPKVPKQWPCVFLSVSLTWHQLIPLQLMVTDSGIFC